jgi:integrase
VTWTKVGKDRYKLRWREITPGARGELIRGPDGRIRRRARSKTVTGVAVRNQLMVDIELQVQTRGYWTEPTSQPNVPAVARLDSVAAGWLRWKRTRCAKGSVRAYLLHARRFVGGLESAAGLPEGGGTVELLRRDLVVALVRALQDEGLSRSSVYGITRSGLELWRWASDDPIAWPGVPTPPREPKALLPRPPRYRAPEAPTLAEADACLRYLPVGAASSRHLGTIMRFTGLRASQALHLKRCDLDLAHQLMHVRLGKSEAEMATARRVPISPHLAAELAPWIADLPADALLFPSRSKKNADRPAPIRPDLFRKAWEAATEWGEVREHTWKPPNRHIARPEHAFRATFQTSLRLSGVAEGVIDALVGHERDGVRGRHYAGASSMVPAMRDAVATLPPIDWRGPTPAKLNRRKGQEH